MKQQTPAILLAITSIVLAFSLYSTKNENSRLRKELTQTKEVVADIETPETEGAATLKEDPGVTNSTELVALQSEEAEPEAESQKEGNRRMMRNMAKMMEENPTINKMIEASQRGAIGALYSDMIEYLGLNAEETQYFMDLLMYRQMANVDAHMKMMSGNLTEEEKKALLEETKLASETTRSGMEEFLNSPEDFDEFKFYEDTIGERMMLSQMDQKLGDAALGDETYREVLEIMHDERENYAWSTDLNDNENRDLSPERFSKENIQKHINDMKAVGEAMDQRVAKILTSEQLAAWRESGEAMQNMMIAQFRQAAQMFGDE